MKKTTIFLLTSAMVFGTIIIGAIIVIAILLYSTTLKAETEIVANDNQVVFSQQQTRSQTTLPDFIYMRTNDDNTLVRVTLSDGSTQIFSLGLPETLIYTSGNAISPDGKLIGFCAFERVSESSVQSRFIVRDIEAGTNLIEEIYPNLPICQVSAFSPDSSQVAVAFIFNSPIDNNNYYPDQPNWALRLYDISTVQVVAELNKDTPNAPDYGSMTDFQFEPRFSPILRVEAFTETDIYFTAAPLVGRDGPLQVPAHHWNLTTDEIRFVEGLTKFGADMLLETGEIVYPYLDEALPAAQPLGPIPGANTIRLDDNGQIRTLYQNTQEVITAAYFINSGQQIVIVLLQPDPMQTQPESRQTRYEILNRDGTTAFVSTSVPSNNSLVGTADGFLMLNADSVTTPNPTFSLASYVDGTAHTLWTTPSELNNSWLRIIWAPKMPVSDTLPPFTPQS